MKDSDLCRSSEVWRANRLMQYHASLRRYCYYRCQLLFLCLLFSFHFIKGWFRNTVRCISFYFLFPEYHLNVAIVCVYFSDVLHLDWCTAEQFVLFLCESSSYLLCGSSYYLLNGTPLFEVVLLSVE